MVSTASTKTEMLLPRAWVVHQVAETTNKESAREEMATAEFNPTIEGVIEGQLSEAVEPAEVVEIPRFIEYRPFL